MEPLPRGAQFQRSQILWEIALGVAADPLPDEGGYQICAAIGARANQISWDQRAYAGVAQVGQDTEATPLDVPLHPGAARWYREQGFEVAASG